MSWHQTELTYRRAAVQNTSPASLVVVLYDALVVDLQKAVVAMRAGEIENRSLHLKHALVILHVLEGSLEMEKGGEMAISLSRFYTHLRTRLLEAQFTKSPEILEQQVGLILDVRGAWQQLDSPGPIADKVPAQASASQHIPDPNAQAPGSWSA